MSNRILLASRSPRRRDLLGWAGFSLEIQPSHADETRRDGLSPVDHAVDVALRKGLAVVSALPVVAADTVVHRGDRIFDMPADRDEARAHLTELSGGWHDVTTGVYVHVRGSEVVFPVTTGVRFRTLSSTELDAYLATGDADDKAGAYGIQGPGGALIAEIRGSWTNVMGLPVEETIAALGRLGVHPWA